MKELFRKTICEMTPYCAPYLTEGIKLDANENTYPVLEALKTHMSEWVKTMPINYYPDTESTRLRGALAKYYGLEAQNVLCGVGSDQIIDCLMRSTLEVGEAILVPTPSFSMYKLTAKINHGISIEVPLKEDFSYDVDQIEAVMLEQKPKLTILCNPNNPTGSVISLEDIERLAKNEVGLLVVDEAYQEFGGESAVKLLSKYPRLIVLRTFSKAFALAGSRVGYALGHKEVIEMINKVKPPYNLNCFSLEMATWVIEHEDLFRPMINQIIASREDFMQYLTKASYTVYPSATNFIWAKGPYALDTLLKDEQIYIKRFMYKDELYYRISIGTKSEMEQVKKRLEQIMTKEGTYEAK